MTNLQRQSAFLSAGNKPFIEFSIGLAELMNVYAK